MSANGFFVPVWLWGYVDQRRRLFRPGACCAFCGTRDPVVLVFRSRPLACRGCRLERRIARRLELHHLGGRPSSLTVEVDVNVHAWLSLYQQVWLGRVEPGSPAAVLCDVLALLTVRLEERWYGASA